MKHSESLSELAPALCRAQGNISGAIKDATNPFFKTKYADMESCWAAVKGPLQAEGLSLVQTMGFVPGAGPTLITTLLHTSGEWISGEQPVCAKADDPQALGSAITYARRYGLAAITALVQVDDDAESFMNSAPRQQTSEPIKGDGGDYVLRFGKFVGRSLDSVGAAELRGYLEWLKKQQKPGDKDSEGMQRIAAYVATRTPQK